MLYKTVRSVLSFLVIRHIWDASVFTRSNV